MKVRIQQLNPTIGAIRQNTEAIIDAVQKAGREGVELLVLPELAVPGYPPMDLLERSDFREAIYRANSRIAESTGDCAVIFGTVTANADSTGRKCFNSALVASNGEVIAGVNKTLLPTYDVFDDLRYFEPSRGFHCVRCKGVNLGITICEDIWYNENDIQYHRYKVNPAAELARQGAEAIINISASPYTKTKPASRREMLQGHVRDLEIPIFYANQVGANTELIFDGDSMAIGYDAEVAARTPLFKEAAVDLDWDAGKRALKSRSQYPLDEPPGTEAMFKALALGLRDYLAKTKVADKVIFGLSGGIDSVLVGCIAAEALGAENVTGVTMPSEFSSEGSVSDSGAFAQNLGIELKEIAIHELYERYLEQLAPLFGDTSFGVAEENLQSRIRGDLLMALSNKFGHMLLNTGNKSELATGYCTLYGDMAGGLGIISDVYKTEVYEMARWLNEHYYEREVIPASVIEKPPSAELRPGQKDSDTLPPYDILDPILELYIEKQLSVEEIRSEGYEEDTVREVIEQVDRTEYKRFQAAPGLKVSTKAFGSGRRWPLAQGWTRNHLS